MPEFIEPVFTKTSPKRSFSVTQNERLGLVFAKTGSIILGTELIHFIISEKLSNNRKFYKGKYTGKSPNINSMCNSFLIGAKTDRSGFGGFYQHQTRVQYG